MVECQGGFWNRDYTREVGRHADRVSLDDDAEVRVPKDEAIRLPILRAWRGVMKVANARLRLAPSLQGFVLRCSCVRLRPETPLPLNKTSAASTQTNDL